MRPSYLLRTCNKRVSYVIGGLVAVAMLSLPLPAQAVKWNVGDTTIRLGGYIKADIAVTTNGVNSPSNLLLTRQHVANADKTKDDRWEVGARESRLFIRTETNGWKTRLEGGFLLGEDPTTVNGNPVSNEFVSNSNFFRLRHATVSKGKWLAGQTWSTFMDLAGLGELLDFAAHASVIFVRQGQIRYTMPVGKGSLMLAAENPATLGAGNLQAGPRPDLVARLNFNGGWGHASVGLLAREFVDAATDNTDSGTGVSVTARLKIGEKDSLHLQYNTGAIGRYMGIATFFGASTASGKIEAVDSKGGSIGYRHWWSDKSRSVIMISNTEADDAAAAIT